MDLTVIKIWPCLKDAATFHQHGTGLCCKALRRAEGDPNKKVPVNSFAAQSHSFTETIFFFNDDLLILCSEIVA
jgi:hypothetical protein